MGLTAVDALSAAVAGRATSAINIVFALLVEPLVTEEAKMRPTVAVVVVGVVAVAIHRTYSTNVPKVAAAVNALNMSVPMVPPPWLEVFAAVTNTDPITPFFVNWGEAPIYGHLAH
jgi:hypothetical protein